MDVSLWKSIYKGQSMDVSFWISNFRGQTLKIKLWRSSIGDQTLEVKLWRSNFGGQSLEIEFWRSVKLQTFQEFEIEQVVSVSIPLAVGLNCLIGRYLSTSVGSSPTRYNLYGCIIKNEQYVNLYYLANNVTPFSILNSKNVGTYIENEN